VLVAGRHDDAELWSGRDRTQALVRRRSGGRDQTRVFDSRHEAWCALRNLGGNFRGVISGHVNLSDCRSAFKLSTARHACDDIFTRGRKTFGLI
jgi:hypothetical protein